MDFNYKKPTHIFALLLIIVSILFVIILPMISFIGAFSSSESSDAETIENMSRNAKLFFEIFVLMVQFAFTFILMVLFPVIWYLVVNNCSIKGIFTRLQLTKKDIDKVIIWGFLTAVLMFAISYISTIIFISSGVDSEELGNVQDLEVYFSPVSILILVAVQPIAEEIFFRGFLYDKIRSYKGDALAITLTAILFGLAHISYNKPYVVLSTIAIGFVLGYAVFKTKNLYSSIFAHTLYNVAVIVLYYLAKSYI